MLKIKKSKK